MIKAIILLKDDINNHNFVINSDKVAKERY